MLKNARVFSGFIVFFWLTLIIEFVILELTALTFISLLIPILLSTIGTASMLFIFIRTYYKSKQSVAKLKHEYLESLKPKAPLRFCASDSELLKAYKESANEISEPLTMSSTQNNAGQANTSFTQSSKGDDELSMWKQFK